MMMMAAPILMLLAMQDVPPDLPLPQETDIIAEINRLREDPQGYVAILEAHRAQFIDAKVYMRAGDPVGRITREGPSAVDDAIAVLAGHAPLPPVSAAPLLKLAAADHASEQASSGRIGHAGPTGAGPGDRLMARGGDRYVSEVIAYGGVTAADVVRQFIVDDGVPGRGHRQMLLSADFTHAGAACAPHPAYRVVCVVELARTPDGTWPKPVETEIAAR